jgi:hypothetical protein
MTWSFNNTTLNLHPMNNTEEQRTLTKQEEILSEQAAEQAVYDEMVAFEERFLASMER